MNFRRPMTPAMTGPLSMPIRIARSSSERRAQAGHLGLHVEGHVRRRRGVVGARLGQPGDDHVGVADRLDLLEAVLLGQPVEGAEDLVEDADDTLRRGPLGERREVDDVGEQDRHVGMALGDGPGVALEALGDGPGQDVEEQALPSSPSPRPGPGRRTGGAGTT